MLCLPLSFRYSKQAFLQDVPNPHDLTDGTPSFMDFMGNRNNRFTTPEAAQKNRIQPPAKVLHYFNAPPDLKENQLIEIFSSGSVKPPVKIKQFPSKSKFINLKFIGAFSSYLKKNIQIANFICI